MFHWLRQLVSMARRDEHGRDSRRAIDRAATGVHEASIRAKYDAAQTNDENRRHWANADGLSADAAASSDVRRTLRNRARYEVANNSYARGIVLTLATDTIGTGPRLQMLTTDDEANNLIEREFMRWARAVNLAGVLRTMRMARAESGEVFSILHTNPAVDSPVQLDLRLVEADQVATPHISFRDDRMVDGIVFDGAGNPAEYHVLRKHPGDAGSWAPVLNAFDPVPADLVIHLFRCERPGQSRGVPELTPALPLFALLRRYRLAVLTAAETAANFALPIYTDVPAGGEADPLEPMDVFEMERGLGMVLPQGWKPAQIKAEHPSTNHVEFIESVLAEIARCLNMPFNVAAGDSSGYNYASGRLDHQTYYKAIRVDQAHIAQVVLDRILKAWIDEAVLIEGYLPQWMRSRDRMSLDHQWFWDGFEHVDPLKEANAQATRLSSHTTTLAIEYAKQGRDWETELRQRSREKALMQELRLNDPVAAPAPAPAPDPSTARDEDDDEVAVEEAA